MNSKPHIIVSEPHRSKRKARGRTYEYWRVRWKCPYTGRNLSKLLGRCDEMTKRDARAEAQRFAVELAARSGPLEPGKTKSVSDLFEGYFQTRDLAPRRVANMRSTCNSLAGLFDARLPARDLTPTHADRWRKHLADSGCAPQTMRSHVVSARAVWAWGLERGYVDANPFKGVKTGSHPTKERVVTTIGDFERMMAVCKSPGEQGMLVCARLLGLRRNEAARATFDDIDWEARVLFVHAKDGIENNKQKNRAHAITPNAYDHLTRLRLEIDGAPGVPHYICGELAGWSETRLNRLGSRIVRDAGLRPRSKPIHQLRGDYATWLDRTRDQAGMSAVDARKMLGHSQDVYEDYYHRMDAKTVSAFAKAAPREVE